jgi:hypothetical protein
MSVEHPLTLSPLSSLQTTETTWYHELRHQQVNNHRALTVATSAEGGYDNCQRRRCKLTQ